MYQTDIAIIGAGPVGLFTIFQAGMLGMKCHVIDALGEIGGQCSALYPEKPIYDIPGHPNIEAQGLIDNLEEQAAPFNPAYHLDQTVTKLLKDGDDWCIATDKNTEIRCKAVIIAAGCGAFGPNRPPIEGLEAYEGKSIFYMVRRKEDFRDKKVVIAGGGDSAVDWAIALHGIAKSIHVVHRRAKFRCAHDSHEKLKLLAEQGHVNLTIPYQLHGLQGQGNQLTHVEVRNFDDEVKILEADILLPFFGLAMELGPLEHWGLNLDHNHISVNPTTLESSEHGVYAIGDIATYENKLKLILNGFAEAALACHHARKYVFPGEVFHFEYSTTKGVPGEDETQKEACS